jgi:hypothetical protein
MIFVGPMLDRYLLCVAHACHYYCHNERSDVRCIYCEFSSSPDVAVRVDLALH